MTGASRTNYPQRPRAARAADDENFVPLDDPAARQAVTLLIQRSPCAVAIQVPQNLEFVGVGELNGGE